MKSVRSKFKEIVSLFKEVEYSLVLIQTLSNEHKIRKIFSEL